MQVQITGLTAVADALHAAAQDLTGVVQRVIDSVATEEANHLADATPVRTGRAKAGWNTEPITDGAAVTNEVFYVPFLIDGTGRRRIPVVNPHWHGMPPNPALRAEWLAAPDAVTQAVERGVRDAITAILP